MLTVRWLGQSGYLLCDGEKTVCIDPYLSDCVNRIAGRPRTREIPIAPASLDADIVICTHDHLDHLDIDAIPQMQLPKMMFLAPSDCEAKLRTLGVCNYTPFDLGKEINIGKIRLQAVFANHSVPAVGVLAEYQGERLYFSGDTEYHRDLEKIQCDYLFICINGKLGNMNVQEASALAEILSPKLAVPNHYDMFESNAEDPCKFNYNNSFIMEFNKEYEVLNGCMI